MALITCPECGKEVSEKATTCPNCGCPIQKERNSTSNNYYQRPNPENKIARNDVKKKGSTVKKVLVGIIIAIILLSLLSSGEESEDTQKKTTAVDLSKDNEIAEEVSEEEIESKNEPVGIGGSFEKDGLIITLNDASIDFTDYKDEYGFNAPKDGMKYVMAYFTFENNSDHDHYVSIYDFKCYADNTSCEQVYSLDDSSFINENISSGRNISFKTYYTVPVDSKEIELEYETNMWSGDKVILKLQ